MDEYLLGKAAGKREARQQLIPKFWVEPYGWGHHDTAFVFCEWNGCTSNFAIAAWQYERMVSPETAVVELCRRIFYQCVTFWASTQGYM